jgi:hypothetical protein
LSEEINAKTAWTAICNPGTLNVSNIIYAIASLFSGGFIGGYVSIITVSSGSHLK